MLRKTFISIVLFTVLCALTGCYVKNSFEKGFSLAPFKKTHGPILKKIESATVCFQNDKKRWSGIAISNDGKVLTALHGLNVNNNDVTDKQLIKNLEDDLRGRYGETEFKGASVIVVFPMLDLAIIDIGLPTRSYLSGSETGPKEEDIVFLAGTSTYTIQIAVGRYFACSETFRHKRASLWVDGPAFKGDSGGAITNEKGELLGVMTDGGYAKDLQSIDPEIFSKRNHVVIATAVPPQLIEEMINSKTQLNVSTSMGNVEKSWGSISLTQ